MLYYVRMYVIDFVVQVMFNQSTYIFNENIGQIRLPLILSSSLSEDITVTVHTNITTGNIRLEMCSVYTLYSSYT